jgi:hypothetical protein
MKSQPHRRGAAKDPPLMTSAPGSPMQKTVAAGKEHGMVAMDRLLLPS